MVLLTGALGKRRVGPGAAKKGGRKHISVPRLQARGVEQNGHLLWVGARCGPKRGWRDYRHH